MTRKKNIIVLFFFILFHLHATGIKANFLANNIINIPQGNLFSSFSKIGINKEAGFSFKFGTLNSTKANDADLAAIAKTGSTDDLVQGTMTLVFDCGGAGV